MGDTLAYVLGYLMWVPSETEASYGDLDPQYLTALTAGYRVYLNEPDAKRVLAHIKVGVQMRSTTSFIANSK
jgi:hypothetical protein